MDYSSHFIGGTWAAPSSQERIEVRSASTGEAIGSTPRALAADVDAAVQAARRAFDDPNGWASFSPIERGKHIERFAEELLARRLQTARVVSQQNGMPIWFAEAVEGDFPASMLRYYAQMMIDSPTVDARPGMYGGTSLVRRRPMGVVGAITPWNVPQGITSLKLGPALAAGNTVVLKPAEETVLDALLMAEAAEAAGDRKSVV